MFSFRSLPENSHFPKLDAFGDQENTKPLTIGVALMRDELQPKPPSQEVLEILLKLALEIEDSKDEDLLASFQDMVPNPVSLWDICHAYGWTEMETFVQIVATPIPRVDDITEAELLEIIEKIIEMPDEFLQRYWISVFERHVPHPAVTDLIFFEDLTPQQIVEKALAWAD